MRVFFESVFELSNRERERESNEDLSRPNSGDTHGHNTWKALLANKHYSAQQAPTLDDPGPDPVYVAIQILDIDEVNEQQMVSFCLCPAQSQRVLHLEFFES